MKNPNPSPRIPRRWPLLVWALGPLGLLATAGLRLHPGWVEAHYSSFLYPRLAEGLSLLTGSFSFSVARGLLVVGCGWLVWTLVVCVRGLRTGVWASFGGLLSKLCLGGFVLYALYLVLWGANQYREPLEQRLSAEFPKDLAAGLVPLARSLAEELGADRPGLGEADFAVLDARGRRDPRVDRSLLALLDEFPEWSGRSPSLRALPFPRVFASFGVSGLFVPFTGEPHFLADGPSCHFPFRAMHEVAHQRGYAREDEANFLAWLMCHRSGDRAFRYSANLVAWELVLPALRKVDRELAEALVQGLPSEVQADRQAIAAYWKSFEGPLETVGRTTNHLFLKSQGQHHGVASYGRMVRLLLWEARSRRGLW